MRFLLSRPGWDGWHAEADGPALAARRAWSRLLRGQGEADSSIPPALVGRALTACDQVGLEFVEPGGKLALSS
jgi:hypothetical protein